MIVFFFFTKMQFGFSRENDNFVSEISEIWVYFANL